jgi:hypothetical protein
MNGGGTIINMRMNNSSGRPITNAVNPSIRPTTRYNVHTNTNSIAAMTNKTVIAGSLMEGLWR